MRTPGRPAVARFAAPAKGCEELFIVKTLADDSSIVNGFREDGLPSAMAGYGAPRSRVPPRRGEANPHARLCARGGA